MFDDVTATPFPHLTDKLGLAPSSSLTSACVRVVYACLCSCYVRVLVFMLRACAGVHDVGLGTRQGWRNFPDKIVPQNQPFALLHLRVAIFMLRVAFTNANLVGNTSVITIKVYNNHQGIITIKV